MVLNKIKFNQEFALVFLIILIGTIFRIYDLSSYSLGTDEVSHSNFANYKSLANFIPDAYREVHPPLTYIFLFLIQQFFTEPIFLRLVSILPGITLILLCYPISFYITGSKKAALFTLLVITFGDIFIELSQGTRSYSFALLFTMLSIFYLFKLKNNLNNRNFIFFTLYSTLSLFSDYSAIITIVTFDAVLLFIILSDRSRETKNILTISAIILFHLFIILGQKILIDTYAYWDFHRIDYKNYKFESLSECVIRIYYIFTRNYFGSVILRSIVFIQILIGFFYILRFKKYYLIILFVLPIIGSVIASHLNLYPLLLGRQSIILSFTLIFLGSFAIAYLDSLSNWKVIINCLLFFLILIILKNEFYNKETNSFYFPQNFLRRPHATEARGLHFDEFKRIYHGISQGSSSASYGAYVGFRIPRFLRRKKQKIPAFQRNILNSLKPVIIKKELKRTCANNLRYVINHDKFTNWLATYGVLNKQIDRYIKYWLIDCNMSLRKYEKEIMIENDIVHRNNRRSFSFYVADYNKRSCSTAFQPVYRQCYK